MRILHLTIREKFFDMIASGEKLEEYRTINPYWIKRLIKINYPEEEKGDNKIIPDNIEFDLKNGHPFNDVLKSYYSKVKDFDGVHFYNGGSPCLKYPNFRIEFKGLEIGKAKPEWSDNWQGDVFIIKLGKIIKK